MASRVDDATLRAFLKQVSRSDDIEGVVHEARGLEAAGAAPHVQVTALERLAQGAPLTRAERYHLEAIIIPDKRPAIDIVNGDYEVTHADWVHLNQDPLRSRLRVAFASIGRIELPDHPSLPYGGTGFLVGPGLLMTNRHVAEIFASGLGLVGLNFIPGRRAGIDFLREIDNEAEDFLAVERVAMIHPYWDMALLAVSGPRAVDGHLLLATTLPGTGHEVAVVGYPAFDPRNPSDVQQTVFKGVYGVKRLQPGRLRASAAVASYGNMVDAALHDASTLGGNSGSCVIDLGTGQVVGLHFGGVYGVANHAVPAAGLATDGRVIDAGVDFDGTAERRATKWDGSWRGLERAAPRARDDGPGSSAAPGPDVAPAASAGGGEARVVIPLEITVRLGVPETGTAAAPGPAAASEPSVVERLVAPRHDPDYAARRGYDERFLGIPLPLPKPRRPGELVRLADGSSVLPYHHFSVALHAGRRLALFTAANVDAREAVRRPGNRPDADYTRRGLGGLGEHDRETWFPDPRLTDDQQIPERFYDRDRQSFDKGHIVRRNDVAWGTTYEEMRNANGDTFHVTNCAPQVGAFNQSLRGKDNWGDLENHVLDEAGTERLAVFAGPVLAEDDPVFTSTDGTAARVPRSFWKLIVAERDGKPMSFGFRLAQDLKFANFEFTVPATWTQYMVGVAEIEDMAGIDFDPAIRAADQKASDLGERVRVRAGAEAGPEAGLARSAPTAPPPPVSIEEILAFWREMQRRRPAPDVRVRFVVTLGRPMTDRSIAGLIRRAFDLKVKVGPLFDADPDLDAFRCIDLPGVVADDRADLFDVARALNGLLGAEAVEPDLGTHYYDADPPPPPEGSAESADWAFWCWVDDVANQPRDRDWAITRTRVREAWKRSRDAGRPSAGEGILIFQPDTGVVASHPELPAGVGSDPRSANFVEGGTSAIDPMTGSGNLGHGTGTGSVAASPTSREMTGSAPNATLVPVRCLTSVAVFNQSPVAQAIDHARQKGAHVISMSLGGVPSMALHAAVRKAVDANIIVVAAAGNCVGQVVWPAAYDEVVAVGGINERFEPWRGSSRGRAVDISGPAELVLRADARDPANPGKVAGGQGTSFATAHLAGVAACWLAHHGRDALVAGLPHGMRLQELFRSAVQRSAVTPPGFDTGAYGAGIVDADGLLALAPATTESVARAPRSLSEQVRDLLADAGAGGQAESAAPVLVDPQNLLEMACIGLDIARVGRTRRAAVEALPPLRVSAGLRTRLDPATAAVVNRGGVR